MRPGLSPASVGAMIGAGKAGEAIVLAREALRGEPDHPAWLHTLGVALYAEGASAEAAATLEHALRVSAGDPVPWNTYGAIQLERGELEVAENALREALRIDAGYLQARFNLALVLRRRGTLGAAAEELRRILALDPRFAAARLERATLHVEQGEAPQALPLLEALAREHPANARVLANLAAAQQRLDRAEDAERSCRLALESPALGPVELAAIAHTFAALGLEDDAERAATRAAVLAPAALDVQLRAGDALALAGRFPAARSQFSAALRLRREAPTLERLGRACLAEGDAAGAAGAFADQLALEPGSRAAGLGLAVALESLGERDPARRVLAETTDRGHRDAEILSTLAHLKARDCEWEGLDALVAELREAARIPGDFPALPQQAMFFDGIGAAEQRLWAEHWARSRMPKATAQPHTARPARERLRIGYVSGDFGYHATALLMAGMLEHHDRRRFEVAAYSYGASDDTALGRRVRSSFERFVDVRALSARAAAARIRADEVDVVVDLGGYVKNARLEILAYRPAPTQGHFLGYPATTGAPFVDFFVADAFTVPHAAEDGFTETVLRMPGCCQPNDPRRDLPDPLPRAACGLPGDALVLCSFNQAVKITPRVFARWCELAQALPNAVLWLIAQGDAAEARLRAFARARGIDASRLLFAARVPEREHIARLRNADIALDTFPCGSHTTASDAMWAGVPLVTVSGETFASRVAGSVVSAAGGGDWVFGDHGAAFEATLALARDRRLREDARQRLEASRASAPLFDSAAFARDFEALLLDAHARTLDTPGSP